VSVIERELFRNLFISVAEEMGVVLRRTAFSPNIKERRDYSCAVYDANGDTVAMGDHMPVHLGAMPLSVRAAIEAFALGRGDVAILNDPFRGGTHLPDITAVSGVFLEDGSRPAYFVASRAHHADVGGMSPGSMPLAREIYQEGLRIPPILLARRGEIDRPLLDMILANVRTPEERKGDLLAQMNANRCGAERLLQMVAKHGRETMDRNMIALQDYSAAMMGVALGQIPSGAYAFSDFLDDDGAGSGPVEIHVNIRISGNSAVVDFAGSSPQVSGSVNANYA
jgi:N-methylhydantoinase B